MTVVDVIAKLPDWCNLFHVICEFPIDKNMNDRWHYADFYSAEDIRRKLGGAEVANVSIRVIKSDPFREVYRRDYDSGIVKDVIQEIVINYIPGIETECRWYVTNDGHEVGLMERYWESEGGDVY